MSEKGLAEHYKVLKQFLVISDDLSTRPKTNSTRAARAREKLLKLSSAQFRELSTDVYDELKRRIDESRGEPDYLLPKSTFHPKRNQARQKLSSLPQSRFKDLVSDISFEIERRDLHHSGVANTPSSNNNSANNSHINAGSLSEQSGGREIPNMDDKAQGGDDEGSRDVKTHTTSSLLNQTIGVQPKTVVPAKANLTWSSDEEDDQPEINKLEILVDEDEAGRSVIPLGDRSLNQQASQKDHSSQREQELLREQALQKDQTIADLEKQLTEMESKMKQLEEKYRLLQSDYDYSTSQNKTLSDEMDNLSEERNTWLKNKSEYEKQLNIFKSEATSRSIDQSKNDNMLQELENLKAANASLRLENHSLKSTTPREANSPQQLVGSPKLSNTKSTGVSVSSSSNDIRKDIEVFLEKLSSLDSKPKELQQSATSTKDTSIWQKRYEDIRSNQISSSLSTTIIRSDDLKSLVTPNGLISLRLISDLQALIESFMLTINDPKPDPDLLFDKISRISLIGNEIANQGDNLYLNSNENSICLREAISYALTATRYFATYVDIVPKMIVQHAIGEVSFTVCDLISNSKLNENLINSKGVDQTSKESNDRKTIVAAETDNGINTAVRPLRMANKLRESQNQNSNSAANGVSETPKQYGTIGPKLSTKSDSPLKGGCPRENKSSDLSPITRSTPTKNSSPRETKNIDLTPVRESTPTKNNSPRETKNIDLTPVSKSTPTKNSSPRETKNIDLTPVRKNTPTKNISPRENKDIDLTPIRKNTPTKNSSPRENKDIDLTPIRRGIIPNEISNQDAPESTDNIDPSPRGKKINALTSNFEGRDKMNSQSEYRKHNDPFFSSTDKKDSPSKMSKPSTPIKRSNVLDKVKQFDSPSHKVIDKDEKNLGIEDKSLNKSFNNSADVVPTAALNDSNRSMNSDFNEETKNSFLLSRSSLEIRQQGQERSDSSMNSPQIDDIVEASPDSKSNSGVGIVAAGAAAGAAAGTAFAGSRGKGLFQSIRERLAPGPDNSPASDAKEGRKDDSVELDAASNLKSTLSSEHKLNDNSISNTKEETREAEPVDSAVIANSLESSRNKHNVNDNSISNAQEEVKVADSIDPATVTNNPEINSRKKYDLNDNSISNAKKNHTAMTQNELPIDRYDHHLNDNYAKSNNISSTNNELGKENISNDTPVRSIYDDSIPSVNHEHKINKVDTNSKKEIQSEVNKKGKGVNFLNAENLSKSTVPDDVSDSEFESASDDDNDSDLKEKQARQRQEYRKSMAAATFNVDLFDIEDPDNTLTQVLLYLEHQTVQVISTIQSLLSAIKKPSATRGDLREKSIAITEVISQMTEATNTSMNQTRNSQLKEHGSWVVKSLDDCNHRMNILCKPNSEKSDTDFADKNFKQRLAGISFDIAKCTKELVKTVEEASLKEDIANLDARLSHTEDLT